MDALTEFLRAAAARTFILGEWDCGLWLADWYVFRTGKPDPAALIRGAPCYRNEDLVHMVRRFARLSKIPRTLTPKRGDVGLIRLSDGAHGGIFTGSRWAVLGEGGGVAGVRYARVIAAWSVD